MISWASATWLNSASHHFPFGASTNFLWISLRFSFRFLGGWFCKGYMHRDYSLEKAKWQLSWKLERYYYYIDPEVLLHRPWWLMKRSRDYVSLQVACRILCFYVENSISHTWPIKEHLICSRALALFVKLFLFYWLIRCLPSHVMS